MDEIILMRKLKRKDEWALGKIIDLYSSYITYIVWELLHKKGTKEDIEEVVADTFISLWLTAERINYKKYSSVKSYLGMIARNKAKDWLSAYGHFPRPSGPRSPARQGHIKRPVLRLAEPSFLRPANQCC